MIIQFSAQIDDVKANKDRTLRIKVDTQELTAEETAHIFALFEKQIWIAMAETELTKDDLNIPEVVDEFDKKSPSQRLRDRMFVYWKEKHPSNDFESFYRQKLDEYGLKYLEALK
jgi:hypothetical protein